MPDNACASVRLARLDCRLDTLLDGPELVVLGDLLDQAGLLVEEDYVVADVVEESAVVEQAADDDFEFGDVVPDGVSVSMVRQAA